MEHINPTGTILNLYIWEEKVNWVILMSDNMFSGNSEYILLFSDKEMT